MAKKPAAIRDLLQGLLKVNAAPAPERDFHLVMNQTVDVTGDAATGFGRAAGWSRRTSLWAFEPATSR
jgi:hypothetical protein